MIEWILILFVHAGGLVKEDTAAVTSVPGFITDMDCQRAGEQATHVADGTRNAVKFVCVMRRARQ